MNENTLIIVNKNEQRTWRKIIKRLSEHEHGKSDHSRKFMKERILEFFSTTEFIKYAKMINFEAITKHHYSKSADRTSSVNNAHLYRIPSGSFAKLGSWRTAHLNDSLLGSKDDRK